MYNDDVLTCLGIASDPDETPTVSYEWSIGGSVVGTSSTLTFPLQVQCLVQLLFVQRQLQMGMGRPILTVPQCHYWTGFRPFQRYINEWNESKC